MFYIYFIILLLYTVQRAHHRKFNVRCHHAVSPLHPFHSALPTLPPLAATTLFSVPVCLFLFFLFGLFCSLILFFIFHTSESYGVHLSLTYLTKNNTIKVYLFCHKAIFHLFCDRVFIDTHQHIHTPHFFFSYSSDNEHLFFSIFWLLYNMLPLI